MLHNLTIIALVLLVFALASVASIWAFGRFARGARAEPAYAIPAQEGATPLDRFAETQLCEHRGASGLSLIYENGEAFTTRAMLARQAQRSLDLVYYTWNEDLTGRLLMAEVLAAADRGVKVRLLLDDIGVSMRDESYRALNAHPQIEVRLFNPTRAPKRSLMRGVEMALRALSMTRRMHNKAWIADNRIAIIGGRNIGDAYFGASGAANFHDLDLFMLGPVVAETTEMFDSYWNSLSALPLRAILGDKRDYPLLTAFRTELVRLCASPEARPWRESLSAGNEVFLPKTTPIIWCVMARLLADPPEKALGSRRRDAPRNWLMEQLHPVLTQAKKRIAITSPYFVPGKSGTEQLVELAAQGVRIEVLTNSLAATDVVAVHGGYAPWRRSLLRGGVSLYELRPTSRRKRLSLRGKSNASLHTKAFTVDDELGFVGSLNFDPRSASLNTEMGVLFEAPELIDALDQIFAAETALEVSYRPAVTETGRLVWHGANGPPLTREPEAGWVRRLVGVIACWLPIRSQL